MHYLFSELGPFSLLFSTLRTKTVGDLICSTFFTKYNNSKIYMEKTKIQTKSLVKKIPRYSILVLILHRNFSLQRFCVRIYDVSSRKKNFRRMKKKLNWFSPQIESMELGHFKISGLPSTSTRNTTLKRKVLFLLIKRNWIPQRFLNKITLTIVFNINSK